MTKKHFIALADMVRAMKKEPFYQPAQVEAFARELARFCLAQNPRFNGDRFLAYINGECGPCGGKV